jgi:hypothetical protein
MHWGSIPQQAAPVIRDLIAYGIRFEITQKSAWRKIIPTTVTERIRKEARVDLKNEYQDAE